MKMTRREHLEAAEEFLSNVNDELDFELDDNRKDRFTVLIQLANAHIGIANAIANANLVDNLNAQEDLRP